MKELFFSLAILAMPILASGCSGNASGNGNKQESTENNNSNKMGSAEKVIDDKVWEQVDRLVYGYHDASVAPEYHRSYTLNVSKDTAVICVTSYGTVLLEEKYVITEEQFKQAIDALRSLNIKSKKADDEDAAPCDGGTAESLSLYADGETIFYGFVDDCEDKLSTMVVGSLRILQALAFLYPKPIGEMVESTMDNPIEDEEVEEPIAE